jgi:hypothetical protein
MAMIKWEGEWLQVSQAFYRPKQDSAVSKIKRKGISNLLAGEKGREEFVEIVAGTLNAGYVPAWDYVNLMIKESIIPIDLDLVADTLNFPRQMKVTQLTNFIDDLGLQYSPEGRSLFDRIEEKITDAESKKVFTDAIKEFTRFRKPGRGWPAEPC